MITSSNWRAWGTDVALAVTEYAALPRAEAIVRRTIADSEAVCDRARGDAEIHALNLEQGVPVQVSARLAELVRSALWAAHMTGGVLDPVAGDTTGLDETSVHPIHPIPRYLDVEVDGCTVHAPYGVVIDVVGTAHADTADTAATHAARALECGVLLRLGDVTASAGHCPAGGWQVALPEHGIIELPARAAIASREGTERWRTVTVIARGAVWADAAAYAAVQRGIGALTWLEQYDLAARLIDARGRIHTTAAWSGPRAA